MSCLELDIHDSYRRYGIVYELTSGKVTAIKHSFKGVKEPRNPFSFPYNFIFSGRLYYAHIVHIVNLKEMMVNLYGQTSHFHAFFSVRTYGSSF